MRLFFVRCAFPLLLIVGILALGVAVPHARWANAASFATAAFILSAAGKSVPQSRFQALLAGGKVAYFVLAIGLLLASASFGPDQAFTLLLSAKWPVLLALSVLVSAAFWPISLPTFAPGDLGALIKQLGILSALAVLIAVFGKVRQDTLAETALAVIVMLLLVGLIPDRRVPVRIYGAITDQHLQMALIMASSLAQDDHVTPLQHAVSTGLGFLLTVIFCRFWMPKPS
jgi:hypothetical protein